MPGHCVNGLDRDRPGLDGPQADAALGVQFCERGDEVWQPLLLRGIEREIASGDDDLVVAGVDETLGAVDDRGEILGARSAAELRDDAECAFPRASVLDFEIGAGCADG